MLAGCAGVPSDESGSYLVQPQDTLYSIAWRHGLDYQDVARWNHLGPDFRIQVGQTLILNGASLPHAAALPRSRASHPTQAAPTRPSASPSVVSALRWSWPTERTALAQKVPGGGILMAGRLGQEVRAACAGRVVYVGDGIRGYGNLIIVKHAENLLSAYAHNRDVSVHESDEVVLGQVIGHMGEGAPGKPVLYFEIRRNGKPVEVSPFLPP